MLFRSLGIAPEVDGLDPELAEDPRCGLVKHPALAGRPEADLRSGPREIDQVDPVGAERIDEIQQERIRVQACIGQIAEIPVRPLLRICASARAEEDEEAQIRMSGADTGELAGDRGHVRHGHIVADEARSARDSGINLPPAKADEVRPVLDRRARLMRQASA